MGNARVLVVNDDVHLAESVCELLVAESYEACVAFDGLAAMEAVTDGQPDLILLDLFMPRLDGWGFLECRARDPALSRTPVLVWSVGSAEDLNRARRLGATECLSRVGSDPDGLLAVIARVLDQASPLPHRRRP
jgi:CheY-like chemotaxis protein